MEPDLLRWGSARLACFAVGFGLAKTSIEFCGSVLTARLPAFSVVRVPLPPLRSLYAVTCWGSNSTENR